MRVVTRFPKSVMIGAVIAWGATPSAFADEVWQCKTSGGHKYTSSQRVPADSCLRDKKAEQSAKPKPREIPQFCDVTPGASCKSVTVNEEYGQLDSADYRVGGRSAIVAAIPGADPSYYDPETKWIVTCRQDKITQTRSCALIRKSLQILITQAGVATIFIGQKHFPSSVSSIRIGQLRLDSTDSDGRFAQSPQIMPVLKDNATIATRYMEWPNRTWVEDEFNLTGSSAAIKLAKWLLVNGKYD